MVYIYGIFNDSLNELVYVGQTSDPDGRLRQHKYTTAKTFKDSCRLEILECGADLTSDDEFFWITCMRSLGCELLNKSVVKRTSGPHRPTKNGSMVLYGLAAVLKRKCLTPWVLYPATGLSGSTIHRAVSLGRVSKETARDLARGLRVTMSDLVKQEVI